MAFFGLGTLPMMSFIVFVGKSISFNWRLRIQKLIPVFISAMAVILILRGLNLDIPFLPLPTF
jgi:sulfite exporter TauE/SafE